MTDGAEMTVGNNETRSRATATYLNSVMHVHDFKKFRSYSSSAALSWFQSCKLRSHFCPSNAELQGFCCWLLLRPAATIFRSRGGLQTVITGHYMALQSPLQLWSVIPTHIHTKKGKNLWLLSPRKCG